jgi:hypothetical protein
MAYRRACMSLAIGFFRFVQLWQSDVNSGPGRICQTSQRLSEALIPDGCKKIQSAFFHLCCFQLQLQSRIFNIRIQKSHAYESRIV